VSAPLDPNFQGYGVQHTDSDGFYSFTTIKPGPYPSSDSNWMRAPHIHFDIQGQVDRKVTQLYFPNEPLNDQDRLLQVVRGDRKTLFAEVTPAVAGTSELLVKWDVILKSG